MRLVASNTKETIAAQFKASECSRKNGGIILFGPLTSFVGPTGPLVFCLARRPG